LSSSARRDRLGDAAYYHQFLVSRDLGGGGAIALRLGRDLCQAGTQTRVWIPGEGAAVQEAIGMGLTVHSFDAERVASRWRLVAAAGNWGISRQLRRLGPGLVHVHSPLQYGRLRWGLRRSGLKRVVHVQIEESEESLRWAFKTPPELIVTCARFLEPSVRRALPAYYRERQRIVAVPNAVDTERFYPGNKTAAKRKVGAFESVPLLLMLANLAPHKGQETAIRAVAALKERGIGVHCWLAGIERGGSGPYTTRLGALIEKLGIGDRVRLLGQRHDVADLLRASDFLLLPSTAEGLPLAILEAQATRVPVLAAPTAGIPEVIRHGDTGVLIPAEDAASYAQWIAELLANRACYHSIAGKAYDQAVQNYNWKAFSHRIADLYRDVLEGEPAG
jgi:glycosyltransferase involved in cell wall biosynthesis